MRIQTLLYREDADWSPDVAASLDSSNTLVLAFGGSRFIEKLHFFSELKSAFPQSHVMGCSTAGEILGREIYDNSVVLAVSKFDKTRLRSEVVAMDSAAGSYAAGRAIAQAFSEPDLRAVFVLSEGLQVNGSELVKGLNAELPDTVVVTGGLAADGHRFQQTWVLEQGQPVSNRVAAVAFYGPDLHVGHGSMGGWDIFGPERRVTRAAGNVLYELDGRPALTIYKEYLGELAAGLPAAGLRFPLALRANRGDDRRFVRTPLAIDEQASTMTFAGDIPEGYLAQLMRANYDHLIEGAEAAALMTKRHGACVQPLLSIAISCVGRRIVLGERTEEEVDAALDALPEHTQQIGFYSYGEISPYASGSCDLHNQTMTLTTFSE